ncbi:hypothetical protein [Cognaticolwellia mytili]|uniref:hypothetical protein n=1 Tax=Cognaticolwellia mytili TaxID=1888913 RepID=UPI000A1775EC|nr:hypothetical protein [Cognaticolwellia mytili]
MQLIINERKVENPLAIIAMLLFAMSLVGGVIALLLFVLLPLIGVFISGILVLVFVIVTPIILWFVLPILFLSIISWFFGKILK